MKDISTNPPLDAASLRALSAKLRGLSGFFIVTTDTTLQGKPIDDDYRMIFNRTYRALREAADVLDAAAGGTAAPACLCLWNEGQNSACPIHGAAPCPAGEILPIEVDDWILVVGSFSVWYVSEFGLAAAQARAARDEVLEIRKADGRVWRRPPRSYHGVITRSRTSESWER